MKLATLKYKGAEIAAVKVGSDEFVSLAGDEAGLPATLMELIRDWDAISGRVSQIAAEGIRIPAHEVQILAPIPAPLRDIICVGKNYFEHAKEFFTSGFDSSANGEAVPTAPVIFTKATTSVAGPGDRIPLWLDTTESVDYEGELGVIISKDAFQVRKADWRSVVFGYTIINDVTSRELQKKHQQWFIGKGIDGFCPMGPWIVTADEFGEPGPQVLETRINGELRQRASLDELIFDIPTLIETISAYVTLKAGDIIATGTPAGVGVGFNPPRYLACGDRISVTITGLGELENTAAAHAAA